jgi:hypothetical protein
MLNTIPRDELKQKIDRKDDFLLVETLVAATYHHAHLRSADRTLGQTGGL